MGLGLSMLYQTESGSIYEIRDGLWRKNDGAWHSIWRLDVLTDGVWVPAHAPEIGKSMAIASREEWWFTTPVVKLL